MQILIDIPKRHYENIMSIDSVSLGRIPYKGIVMYSINAIKNGVVQEPRKGHWIEHPHEAGPNWEYSMYECSKCRCFTEDDSDFCPNCGADMKELKE